MVTSRAGTSPDEVAPPPAAGSGGGAASGRSRTGAAGGGCSGCTLGAAAEETGATAAGERAGTCTGVAAVLVSAAGGEAGRGSAVVATCGGASGAGCAGGATPSSPTGRSIAGNCGLAAAIAATARSYFCWRSRKSASSRAKFRSASFRVRIPLPYRAAAGSFLSASTRPRTAASSLPSTTRSPSMPLSFAARGGFSRDFVAGREGTVVSAPLLREAASGRGNAPPRGSIPRRCRAPASF